MKMIPMPEEGDKVHLPGDGEHPDQTGTVRAHYENEHPVYGYGDLDWQVEVQIDGTTDVIKVEVAWNEAEKRWEAAEE